MYISKGPDIWSRTSSVSGRCMYTKIYPILMGVVGAYGVDEASNVRYWLYDIDSSDMYNQNEKQNIERRKKAKQQHPLIKKNKKTNKKTKFKTKTKTKTNVVNK